MIRISAALAIAAVLAVPAVHAQELSRQPGELFRDVQEEVKYQMATSALAVATLCGRSPAWQTYDADALLADYRSSREYLEKYAPGRRIYAESQTYRLLRELNELNVTAGPDPDQKRCINLAPALLSKYRPKP